MPQVFFAKVKSVLSADTVVLTSPKGNQERVLTLAYLQSPRLQTNEKYAFEARELLRNLLVGKQVKFWVLYKSNTNREFGDISSPIFQSLIEYVLSKGAAKLRDNVSSSFGNEEDDIEKLSKVQKEAELNKIGLWDPNYRKIELIDRPSNLDSTPVDAIVEKVLSGDRLLVRILVGSHKHSVIPVLIAGVKTPRSSSNDEPAEEYGDEAKEFVESKLLMRSIQVSLLGESLSGVLVANIIHPNGNIAEKLLEEGFAEVCDWQSSIVGAKTMGTLRKHEKQAREAGKNLWKKHASSLIASSDSNGSKLSIGSRNGATVGKIISADTILLRFKDDTEATVQLISLRAPRPSDPATSAFVNDAREYVRHKLIGKHVDVVVEGIREGNEQFDERPLVTIRTSDGKNINEDIVANGFASVIRHRRGDPKPDYWDGLIETESLAIKAKRGIHGKAPATGALVDASENAMRAKPYLFTFQNRTKIAAVVEHVISGTRFRVVIPKEGVKLVLVLGGLANPANRDDTFARKALELATKKFYQRDVNIEIYGADKVGGFIGNISLPGSNVPFQVSLLKEGLVKTHDRSVSDTKHEAQLREAEQEAKEKKLGVWENYDPSADESVDTLTEKIENLKIEREYFDAKVCEILPDGLIALHILDPEEAKLKAFMAKYHSVSSSFPAVSSVKRNDIISAKLKDNGKYYRARVLDFDRAERKVKVQHLDYGTIDTVLLSDVRSLPGEFSISSYKPQAHIAQLSLINLPPKSQEDYLKEAIYYLEDTLLDKQVVACVTFRNPAPGVEFDVELYDPEMIAKDATRSLNKDMVSEGWGLVKKKNLKTFEKLLNKEQNELLSLENEAKSSHIGCWEYGDVEGDDEL
jgi:staphylococcal nuclease domain-containing protein 1